MAEYRDDDETVGYCPKCGRRLANLTTGLRGYCEEHGWTFADFAPALGNAGWGVRHADGEWVSDGYDTAEDAAKAALR